LEIQNAVVNVFPTLADATAYATSKSYDADQNGQEIVVLENPITQNGNTRYQKYEWADTAYRLLNGTVGSDEVIISVTFPPIQTFTGGDDTGIIAEITPTLPQGVKLITSTDTSGAVDVIYKYEVTDAGLPTQSIAEIDPPTLIYENTTVETEADIATSVLGLRPNTIYKNTDSGVVIQTDAAGTALVLEDGIFDFEFISVEKVLAVGANTIDINDPADISIKVPSNLGNVEAFSADLLSLAVEALDKNNDDAKSTQSVNILPLTTSTFSVVVAVAGTYKFSAHLNVKKQ
jgi:hypothetical protein